MIVFIFNFSQLFMVTYLLNQSFYPDSKTNRLEIFNEICVLSIIYFFIALSDFVQAPEPRVWTGEQLVNFTVLLMVTNYVYIGVTNLGMPVFDYFRLRYLKRDRLKQMRRKQRQNIEEKV